MLTEFPFKFRTNCKLTVDHQSMLCETQGVSVAIFSRTRQSHWRLEEDSNESISARSELHSDCAALPLGTRRKQHFLLHAEREGAA